MKNLQKSKTVAIFLKQIALPALAVSLTVNLLRDASFEGVGVISTYAILITSYLFAIKAVIFDLPARYYEKKYSQDVTKEVTHEENLVKRILEAQTPQETLDVADWFKEVKKAEQ